MWCAIDDIVSSGSRRSWAVNNKTTIYKKIKIPKVVWSTYHYHKKLEILVENQLVHAIPLNGKVQKNVCCDLR